jgi:hypothetical protein
MSTVKELMLSPAGIVAVPALDEDAGDAEVVADVVDGDDEQPAATMAATAAKATKPNLGSGLNLPWPCERECHPP